MGTQYSTNMTDTSTLYLLSFIIVVLFPFMSTVVISLLMIQRGLYEFVIIPVLLTTLSAYATKFVEQI